MRIGTWNLAGRWSRAHARFLADSQCDVWLLTEVAQGAEFDDGDLVRSAPMGPSKSYAAVWAAGPLVGVPAVHEASAAATLTDVLLTSSVLPWRSCGSRWPDPGATVASKTAASLDRIGEALARSGRPIVWGGDWNNAFEGPNRAGTLAGAAAIRALVDRLDLQIATAAQPHTTAGLFSIDHIAVPAAWQVGGCRSVRAQADGKRLSDHDAYVAEVSPVSAPSI